MQTEIEATFLDVVPEAIKEKLKELGATCKQPQFFMKCSIYDYDDLRLDKKAAWIRVRQEANKATMCFKQRQSEDINGMKEVEFTVSDFKAACDFLEAIGLKQKAVQESKREVWQFDDCEIMLDEWPWIPPYIEIEGPSEKSVKNIAKRLNLDYKNAIFDSTDAIYQKYFDVGRTEISTTPITFTPIPDWLEKKRK